jgi:transposase InsO family protein
LTGKTSASNNALAERVNGIVKNEFFPKKIYRDHKEAKKSIEIIIKNYNEKRPHGSLDYLTPSKAHDMSGEIKKRWKHYPYKKKDIKKDQMETV